MKIILTHEQADFDALASLLGAHLLDEFSIPVLPRRMNRNVRAFLNLYGVELSFVEPGDLALKPIDAITLVDTQSLVSIKGMGVHTRVHVIDHHPLREDLSPDWEITVSGTGANTTIFVETLRERDIVLGTIQSTLLLLGIYEDTGSLTYTRTTARDLRAASYLLEQGASLQIATDFLNHPLSTTQQIIYDQLRASAKYHSIHGHNIIIACGDVQDVDEELSTVVHKLRDLLDPDALIVLITTRGGVQLIARSTSDNIDVARLATHFGGGGHERAAAGIIKNKKLGEVQQELIGILPRIVQPAISVAQIMSGNPQLLSPDTLADDAAKRMQRYGHEGYPVVSGGKVIGLLTRRAVDRAISHKLSYYTAESLMDAGEHTLRPGDSIESLQRLMTITGWGQIPVVDPLSGEIIGIVTRTDLLKTLTSQPRVPSRLNLSDRLERALPPARLALLKVIAAVADEEHIAVYIVGGFVRDLLLDRPSLDFDLVVEGDAIALAHALAKRYGGRITSHSRFGTAKWLLRQSSAKGGQLIRPLAVAAVLENGSEQDLPASLDLVTARTEFYTYPTALPTVERGSIKLDLHRRDFTVNTLALRLDGQHYGELHDYWGGLADLRQGYVRVLHSLSFVDDPTRILRAVRFEQRFGFQIETRTLNLLIEALSLLDRVSGDRIRHELNNVLVEEQAGAILNRLDGLGIFSAIHPGLRWDAWLVARVGSLVIVQPGEGWLELIDSDENRRRIFLTYILWLLRLSPDQARSVGERLKLPAQLRHMIHNAGHLWLEIPALITSSPSQITARFDVISPMALFGVYLATDLPEVRQILDLYVSKWRKITPIMSGHDLRAKGVPPGPIYKEVLIALRKAWLDGEVSSLKDEAALLNQLLTETNIK